MLIAAWNSVKRFSLFILLIPTLAVACGSAVTPTPAHSPQPRTLAVFAAASLTDAFGEIGVNFEAANPGVSVALNFAASQTLSTQLIQGASADVFASANKTEMDKVVAANLVRTDAPRDFLTNQLIVILPKDNPANIESLQDLAKSGLKLVLTDKTVPAGKYTLQSLDNMVKEAPFGADFKTRVLANVVSYENDVKLVVAKVQLGEADAGIVYISDSVAAPELKTIEIPANLNVIARYPIAALTNSPQPQLAANLITYVLSSDGQTILKKWGFTPITP
jgi:molybdate transport system substrate-binding protein